MLPILLALVVFALAGVGLTKWLQHQAASAPMVAVQPERGPSQLAELSWRQFARLVLKAMNSRGYRLVDTQGQPTDTIPTDGSDMLLLREDVLTLLVCKYGTGSVVASSSLTGVIANAKLRGATHSIVVTPGSFDQDAIRFTRNNAIELMDGEQLWPEVRPYVSAPTAVTVAPALKAPARSPLMAWGGAAVAGVLVWAIANALTPSPETAPTADVVAAQPATPSDAVDAAEPAANPASNPAAPASTAATPDDVPTDQKALDLRRREVAKTISTLFGVDRALWSTQSTLLVYLSAAEADPMNELCPLLERYPELAMSRIQLQPPAGSAKPVRFKQCRTY